ncbi:hypothetical protein [Streptomyces sp. FXY-T5]|uniref:hypothetical protein n=1 Tax=unclassified Streptomyces TaxID=2593676 RepID=UPI00359CA881
MPITPGRDFAGIVEAVGEGISEVEVGCRPSSGPRRRPRRQVMAQAAPTSCTGRAPRSLGARRGRPASRLNPAHPPFITPSPFEPGTREQP